ncbi:hypothetical protein B0H13DRAFT_2318373 [Mycena leptocephala]|nr:hypothetical protein B0H13DRAFT_2318373 [Mycena leptocephala]
MSLSPHTSFCVLTPSVRSSFSSSKHPRRRGSASSYFPDFPLPVPVPLDSLSFPAPSLGSNDVLPRPKRGAPPIDPPPVRPTQPIPEQGFTVLVKKSLWQSKTKTPTPVHPAVCAEWL